MKSRLLGAVCTCLVFLGITNPVSAASIVNGSDILSQTDADQLEMWLDEGPLQLSSLGSLTSGSLSAPELTFDSFHNLVDNHGRTFVLIEAFVGTADDGTPVGPPVLLGGYNPQDWFDSREGDVLTPKVSDMTAFIFNLTSGVKLDQTNQYQTSSASSAVGLRFGRSDLFIPYDDGPHSGINSVFNGDYCAPGTPKAADQTCQEGLNLLGYTGWIGFGANSPITLEVFTIATVPIPPALYLFGSGLIGLVGMARRRAAYNQ